MCASWVLIIRFSSAPLNPDLTCFRVFVRDVSGVAGSSGFDQQNVTLAFSNRFVLDAAWHHAQLALLQFHRVITKLDQHPACHHVENLIGFRVLVPDEFTFDLGQLEMDIIHLCDDALDMLLFQWLAEFVFYKDAESLLLLPEKTEIKESEGEFHLYAGVAGEMIDATRHEMVTDVKAVTLHQFRLEQTPQGWQVRVILDI